MNEMLYPYHLAPGETGNESYCEECHSSTICTHADGRNLCFDCAKAANKLDRTIIDLKRLFNDYGVALNYTEVDFWHIVLHKITEFKYELIKDLYELEPTGLKNTYKITL